jgi:hypothetical protein
MHLSSISNSESAPRPDRRWRTFVFAVLAVCMAIEVALRFAPVRALLPARTHYYHPGIAQRLDALERMLSAHDRVDVLFIGSSIVLTNVHPLLFDSVVAGQLGQVFSFNAGLPGLWPSSVHLYLEHVWLPAARPRIVIQGIRYAELAATTHAKHQTQVWTGRIEPAWRDSDLLTRLTAKAVKNIYLLQYRGTLIRALQRYRNGRVAESEDDDEYAGRGYQPRRASAVRNSATWEEDLPNDGTCESVGCDVGFAALRRSIAAVRAAGSTYVLLNVPEHPDRWRGPDAGDRYAAYVNTLRGFAASEGVAFIDPTDGNATRFGELPYYDFSHMTAEGSRQFTRALAERMGTLVASRLPKVPPNLHANHLYE